MLINQCPHNLDLLQWLVGMSPTRVTAVASLGKTHPIEVEDEVSAILEYANGAYQWHVEGRHDAVTGKSKSTKLALNVVG